MVGRGRFRGSVRGVCCERVGGWLVGADSGVLCEGCVVKELGVVGRGRFRGSVRGVCCDRVGGGGGEGDLPHWFLRKKKKKVPYYAKSTFSYS